MNLPKISVIVPVYNVENYLSKCIESILAQTFKDFELLLVNDGSTDASKTICEAYVEKDNRIRLINKINGGVSSARNIGIKESSGHFISFVDSDDSVKHKYLEDLYDDNLLAEQPCLVMHNYKVDNLTMDFNDRNLDKINVAGSDIYDTFLSAKLIKYTAPYSKLFSSKLIKENSLEFPLGVHMGEDAIFMLRYLYYANGLITSNKCNYLIFRRDASLMQTFNSFESEYLGYQLWKNDFLLLQEKYSKSTGNTKDEEIWDNVEYPLIRCIQSVYKSKSNLKLTDQKKQLLTIPETDYYLFNKYYRPTDIKSRVSKALIKDRLFYLYCFIGRIITK